MELSSSPTPIPRNNVNRLKDTVHDEFLKFYMKIQKVLKRSIAVFASQLPLAILETCFLKTSKELLLVDAGRMHAVSFLPMGMYIYLYVTWLVLC